MQIFALFEAIPKRDIAISEKENDIKEMEK